MPAKLSPPEVLIRRGLHSGRTDRRRPLRRADALHNRRARQSAKADDIMETFDDFRAEEAFRLFADTAG